MFENAVRLEDIAGEPETVIANDMDAEMIVQRIAEIESDRDRMIEWQKTQIAKITESAERRTSILKSYLLEYMLSNPHKTTPTGQKKYELPSATLVETPAKLDYERDDEALLGWCKEYGHTELIKVKESASWSDIKNYIKDTGEIPTGVTVVEKPAEFKVRIKEAPNE